LFILAHRQSAHFTVVLILALFMVSHNFSWA
jgi:hypothetical protein